MAVGPNENVGPLCHHGFVTTASPLRRASSPRSAPLLDTHPHLLSQFHPTLNGDLDVVALTAGSQKRPWWQCAIGPDHVWRASVANRTGRSSGCPYCAGHRASATNSLAARFPAIAAQLDPDCNGALTASQIVAGSNTKVWWRCLVAADHIWEADVVGRTTRDRGCPCCAGKKVSVTNSLAKRYPGLAAQLDPSRNGGLTADKIVAGSSRKV